MLITVITNAAMSSTVVLVAVVYSSDLGHLICEDTVTCFL